MKKSDVLAACNLMLEKQKAEVLAAVQASKEAANNETKSSAGDKYETTRAMMHFEQEKLSNQLAQLQKTEALVFRASQQTVCKTGGLGALLKTTVGYIFIAAGLGKVEVNGTPVLVISLASPLGKMLFGAAPGHVFSMAQNSHKVEAIF